MTIGMRFVYGMYKKEIAIKLHMGISLSMGHIGYKP